MSDRTLDLVQLKLDVKAITIDGPSGDNFKRILTRLIDLIIADIDYR